MTQANPNSRDTLISVFKDIYQLRMFDIPVCNKKLDVFSTDFILWNDAYVCVLVTPWFMNLVLLPIEEKSWNELEPSTKSIHHFPSGKYEFIAAEETRLGIYQSCSLFSPMFEFSNLNAAIETANNILKELMNEKNISESDLDRTQEINDIWNGVSEKETSSETSPEQTRAFESLPYESEEPQQKLEEIVKQRTIDRRQLLRGEFAQDGAQDKIKDSTEDNT